MAKKGGLPPPSLPIGPPKFGPPASIGLPAFPQQKFGPPIPPKIGNGTGVPLSVPSGLPPPLNPFIQKPMFPSGAHVLPGPQPPQPGPQTPQPVASTFLPNPKPGFIAPPPVNGYQPFPPKASFALPPMNVGPAPMQPPSGYPSVPQPVGFPPAPYFQPGRVDVIPPPQSPSSSLKLAPQPVDPLKCLFCGVRQIQPQSMTPCGHGYCSPLCLQLYIKSCYDGAHFDNIPCICCRVPFALPFMTQAFGDENEFRRNLREHIENVLKTRVCPGNEELFNQLTGYYPQPPFNCAICKQVKPFKERWDLRCVHTLCKECLVLRMTQSIRVERSFANFRCPSCPAEIQYLDLLCLLDKELRVEAENLSDPKTMVDGTDQLIRYQCHIHTSFVIYLDPTRPWVMCNFCRVRYCTHCPPRTLFVGHLCPNTLPYRG